MSCGRPCPAVGPCLALLLTVVVAACDGADLPEPALPAGSSAPHLAAAADGTVVLSYVVPDATGARLEFVELAAGRWRPPRRVAAGPDWFVNWADFPAVVPLAGELWAAHWRVRSADDRYAYDAVVAVSEDGGRSWSPGRTLHSDGTPTEHGFVSLYPLPEGIGAVWLDGRNLAVDPDSATQLYSAVIRASDRAVLAEQPLDERVCDCCQTDVAATGSGPLVVYRDRSADEIRDIAVSRLGAQGWEPGRRVMADDWRISGCPVNGPAVAADGDRVVVARYTGEPQRRVSVAFSEDAGSTFTDPLDVALKAPLGRVDVVLLESGEAVVSWLADLPGRVLFRQVDRDGTLGPIRTVAPVSPERNAGFPQMIRSGAWLVFAWTDPEANRVRTRRLPVAG